MSDMNICYFQMCAIITIKTFVFPSDYNWYSMMCVRKTTHCHVPGVLTTKLCIHDAHILYAYMIFYVCII